MISYMVASDGTLTTMSENGPVSFGVDHPLYNRVRDAIEKDDEESLYSLVAEKSSLQDIVTNSEEDVSFQNGVLCYRGKAIDQPVLIDRLLDMVRQKFDISPFLRFVERLMNNPSNKSVEQLFNFLSAGGLQITKDGCFLGYKFVQLYDNEETTDLSGKTLSRGDFVDHWSGTIRNNVGDTVSMPRNEVVDDPNQACAAGLHVGTFNYSVGSNKHVIVVKVDPEHAVSVPKDHSFEKLRTCEYTVVSVLSPDRKRLNAGVYDENDGELTTEEDEDIYYDYSDDYSDEYDDNDYADFFK